MGVARHTRARRSEGGHSTGGDGVALREFGHLVLRAIQTTGRGHVDVGFVSKNWIDAGFRSGSVVTARCARRLGRPVLAVPGPVTAATSTGCNQMIRDGDAQLVTRAVDVIDAIDASASR
jgi:hypothetical protein